MSTASNSLSPKKRILLGASLIALVVFVFSVAFAGIVLTGSEDEDTGQENTAGENPGSRDVEGDDADSVDEDRSEAGSEAGSEDPSSPPPYPTAPYEQPGDTLRGDDGSSPDLYTEMTNSGISLALAQLTCERHLEQSAPYGSVVRWGTGSLEPMLIRDGEAWRLESMITVEGAFENSGADYSMVCVVSGPSGHPEVESFDIR